MIRFASIALLALLLAGCATRGPASIVGGECRIFERPQYEVRGKRDYDQDWIDSQVEGGVGGCRWKRPAKRPAALDAVPATSSAIARPAKRRGLVARVRDRMLPARSTPAETVPLPAPTPVVIAPNPAPPAPRPPRSAIERLLDPHDDN